MDTEKGQSDSAPKKKLRFLTREEKERLGRLMLGEEHPPNGIMSKKSDDAAEIRPGDKPSR